MRCGNCRQFIRNSIDDLQWQSDWSALMTSHSAARCQAWTCLVEWTQFSQLQ